jgi:hypothetical protein
MPQLQNLVLTDRESTPVDHTFKPRDISQGVGSVVESTGTPIGDNRFTVALNKTSTGRYKATLKGVFPVVQDQTINGVTSPVVVRTSYADISFTFDERSTTEERNNVVGMIQSALSTNNSLVNDTIVDLEGIY